VSEHLVDPHQGTLLDVPRDWRPLAEAEDLPSPTPAAQQLIEQFRRHAVAQGWKNDTVYEVSRSLRLLLGWVGIDAPIPERDIRSLPTMVDNTTAQRVLLFLDQHGLVTPDPDRLIDPHQRWIETKIAAMPEQIADELHRWVRVLRGEGRHAHPARSFEVIRNYLFYAYPTLQAWTQRVSSLREITRDDVAAALTGKTGTPAQGLRTGLRSIFRALKQERLVFRDPTKTVSLATVENLPTTLSSDQLRGLLERTEGAMARLTVALVAIHALGVDELRQLGLADLDMARGQLRARRRIVYLDEVTHDLARGWLHERHQLWPDTVNPHLLITASGAYATPPGPIAAATINRIFRQLGLQPSTLRQDRILDEARETADPLYLMRVFGISATTAMKYVYAAHPERRSTLPH
jgi:integrase